MSFIHFILVDNPEDVNEDWDNLISCDYCVHCLYSVGRNEITLLGDNIHDPIEAQIDSFLDGVLFCEGQYFIHYGIMFRENDDEICRKAKEHDWRNVD